MALTNSKDNKHLNDIPIVDFSSFSLDLAEEHVKKEDLAQLAKQICDAFKTSGFVYLKNFGIEPEKIEELRELALKFFEYPTSAKEKYQREGTDSNHGWVALEREILNLDRPGDLKEAYNVTPQVAKSWPNDIIPEFESTVMERFKTFTVLSNRVNYLMGLGLNLKNPNLFRETHNPLINPCPTTLRLLYYPVLPPGTEVKPNQIRCGEHSDYGSITLLFQDDVGGLEVLDRQGVYVSATPVPGTVLVNVADLMQQWTSDTLVSTKHRVVLPKAEIGRNKARISIAFFVHPDNDCLIECIDGSNKYEPITSLEYLNRKLDATYAY